MIIASSKRRFSFIVDLNAKFIISIFKIQFYKYLRLAQTIQCFENQKKEMTIFDNDCIQAAIIDTKTQFIILLRHKENKRFCKKKSNNEFNLFEINLQNNVKTPTVSFEKNYKMIYKEVSFHF